MTLRSIFLDLDHTLLDTDSGDEKAYELTMDLAGQENPSLDLPRLQETYMGILAERPFSPDGEVVESWRRKLWHEALMEQNCDDFTLAVKLHDLYYDKRVDFFEWFAGVPEMLADLRKNYKLIIITNGDSKIQWPKLNKVEAVKHVDGIIVSGDTDIHKPDKAIFDMACELADCEATQAIHIGDSLKTDIQGGINAGLKASIWVRPEGTTRKADDPEPHFEIECAIQLPEVIEQLEN